MRLDLLLGFKLTCIEPTTLPDRLRLLGINLALWPRQILLPGRFQTSEIMFQTSGMEPGAINAKQRHFSNIWASIQTSDLLHQTSGIYSRRLTCSVLSLSFPETIPRRLNYISNVWDSRFQTSESLPRRLESPAFLKPFTELWFRRLNPLPDV